MVATAPGGAGRCTYHILYFHVKSSRNKSSPPGRLRDFFSTEHDTHKPAVSGGRGCMVAGYDQDEGVGLACKVLRVH
jgi:hypothetical protein